MNVGLYTSLAASADLYGTMGAGVLTSIVGALAYRSNQKSKERQEELDERTSAAELKLVETDKAVEIERVEREGWVTLIESLRDQYKDATEESSKLRDRLRDGNERFDKLEEKMRAMKADHDHQMITMETDFKLAVASQVEHQARSREIIAELRSEVSMGDKIKVSLGERIDALRAEVRRLGGDVDEINRVGKRGQQGDKGEVGDKGEPGDSGIAT